MVEGLGRLFVLSGNALRLDQPPHHWVKARGVQEVKKGDELIRPPDNRFMEIPPRAEATGSER